MGRVGKSSITQHVFSESLQRSHEYQDRWLRFYQSVWPGCRPVWVQDLVEQRLGVDVRITIGRAGCVTIDEKIRHADYGDFLVEQWSSQNRPGWTVDPRKVSTFIAWAVEPKGEASLIDYSGLRSRAVDRMDQWTQGDPRYPRKAINTTWTTINVAIPWREITDLVLCTRPW